MKIWEYERLAKVHEELAHIYQDMGRFAEAEQHQLEADWARECIKARSLTEEDIADIKARINQRGGIHV